MELLLQSLQSYTNARLVVLRTLANSSLSCPHIAETTNLTISMLRGRQQNPALWKPHELGQLADVLGFPNRFADHLNTISTYLDELSPGQFQQVRLLTKLTTAQIASRKKDYRLWQYPELERLLNGLRKLAEDDRTNWEQISQRSRAKRTGKNTIDFESRLRSVSQ
ncbi:hypothetical protein GCM10027341_32990 [Spirosoma knui]